MMLYHNFSLTNLHRVFYIRANGTCISFFLKKGTEKALMITDKLTFAKYLGDSQYMIRNKNRITSFINLLIFPHSKVIGFDLE